MSVIFLSVARVDLYPGFKGVSLRGVLFLYCSSSPGTSDVSFFDCFYFFYHALQRGVYRGIVYDSYEALVDFST